MNLNINLVPLNLPILDSVTFAKGKYYYARLDDYNTIYSWDSDTNQTKSLRIGAHIVAIIPWNDCLVLLTTQSIDIVNYDLTQHDTVTTLLMNNRPDCRYVIMDDTMLAVTMLCWTSVVRPNFTTRTMQINLVTGQNKTIGNQIRRPVRAIRYQGSILNYCYLHQGTDQQQAKFYHKQQPVNYTLSIAGIGIDAQLHRIHRLKDRILVTVVVNDVYNLYIVSQPCLSLLLLAASAVKQLPMTKDQLAVVLPIDLLDLVAR